MKIRMLDDKQVQALRALDVPDTREELHAYVVTLRDSGVTLQAIADVLGTSRQFVSKMEGKGRKAVAK